MVIDTHTHAWGPPTPEHPWVNESIVQSVDRFDVDTIYTAEKLLADMDRLQIDEAVVVGYPIVEWTDNWYTLKAASEYDRLHGVVMLDHFGDDAVGNAADCLRTDGVVGLRIAPGMVYNRMWRDNPPDADPTWLLDAIEREEFGDVVCEEDASVTISCGFGQLEQVRQLIERYPDITYLFDAYGPLSADSSTADRERFGELTSFDNVGVKASHTPYMSNHQFPYEDVHELLEWTVETFGRERVVWGSDFPNVSQHEDAVTYAEAYNWLAHVDELSDRDRSYVEGRAFSALIDC